MQKIMPHLFPGQGICPSKFLNLGIAVIQKVFSFHRSKSFNCFDILVFMENAEMNTLI